MKKAIFFILAIFTLWGISHETGFGSILTSPQSAELFNYTKGSIIVDGVILDLEFSGSSVINMQVSDRSAGNTLNQYAGRISITNSGNMYYFNGTVTLNGQQHQLVDLPILIYANLN